MEIDERKDDDRRNNEKEENPETIQLARLVVKQDEATPFEPHGRKVVRNPA